MSFKTISAIALASLLTLGAGLSTAQDAASTLTPEEAWTMRIALMRSNNMTMRGAADLTGDAAIAAMTTMVSNFQTIPTLFPEGPIPPESGALPAILENFEAFTAIAKSGEDAAQAALDAATAGDMAAYIEAVGQIGQVCGTCHQQFRS